jgi:hypothetical protein
VNEKGLKNWLKPERDENLKVSEAELERLIAKRTGCMVSGMYSR